MDTVAPSGDSIRSGAWASLSKEHRFLLLILGCTSLFDGFDRGIVQVALPQIRGTFDLSQSAMSWWLVGVYAGALPALLITRAADKVGRKRLLMFSIVGYMAATGLTAVAPTIQTFIAAQFLARLFLTAEHALVLTLAAEELPADKRGFGFGLLSMMLALGFGTAAVVYGTIFEPAGISWRFMYVVGLPPLLAIGWLRRRIPESRRFEEARAAGRLERDWRAILRGDHLRWVLLLCVTAFLLELATHAGAFTVDFLQEDRGLSSAQANLMLVLAGTPGIPLMVYAGSLSDRFGRRVVGCTLALMGVVGALGFFWVGRSVPVLGFFMAITLTGQLGAGPVLATYASELFPTSLRGQAGSWAKSAGVLGQAASFALGGLLITLTGGLPGAASILIVGTVVAVAIVAVAFPDTHGRELEDITERDVMLEQELTPLV